MAYYDFNSEDTRAIQELNEDLNLAESLRLKGPMGEFQREPFMYEVRKNLEGEYTGLICEGGVLKIDGKEKSGKSRVLGAAASASLHTHGGYWDLPDQYPLFKYNKDLNEEKGFGLYIDTENGGIEFETIQRSILKSAGYDEAPDFYKCYPFRRFTDYIGKTRMLVKYIEELANSRIGLDNLFLDVSTDFVNKVNDEDTAKEFWDLISKLSEKYKFCCLNTMHQNKGNDSSTGIFGGFADKKASYNSSIFSSSMDERLKIWTTKNTRLSESFRSMTFIFDEITGLPVQHFG